jgi:hypothetical protein
MATRYITPASAAARKYPVVLKTWMYQRRWARNCSARWIMTMKTASSGVLKRAAATITNGSVAW